MSSSSSSVREHHFSIVLARTQKYGIGACGGTCLPWPLLKNDMKRFLTITTNGDVAGSPPNLVIMGRRTYESLPNHVRPLKRRINMVISSSLDSSTLSSEETSSLIVVKTWEAAFEWMKTHGDAFGDVFAIGGSRVYHDALTFPQFARIYETLVLKDFACDTFVDAYAAPSAGWELDIVGAVTVESDTPYQFLEYKRRHEISQFTDIARDIMRNGTFKMDRTKVGTLSVFGRMSRYSMRDGTIPLDTTRRQFFKGLVVELVAFLSGVCDSKPMEKQNVNIWKDNCSREFLDKCGFPNREEGDMGAIYPHSWRHWGAQYVDCKTDYTGKGIDQIQRIINILKVNVNDRRLVVVSLNPSVWEDVQLPCCHTMFQFNVSNGELSVMFFMRSSDHMVASNWNLCFYSLLTHMLAQVVGLKTGDVVMVTGDTHIYANHVETARVQVEREPRPFPRLKIKRSVQNIFDFVADDFELEDYEPHGSLKYKMNV